MVDRVAELRSIASNYIDTQTRLVDLRTPEGAAERCRIASDALAELYGGGAVVLRLHGHRRPVSRPRTPNDDDAVHHVVAIDGLVVDITRKQFDESAPDVLIYPTLAAVGADWCGWSPDHNWDEITAFQPPPHHFADE